MGTTAEKLTYLNETKGKIKDSINLTGAGITNEDTFRSYAVKLRDGLVQVLNDNGETLYNNFPKVSGTGNNISLSNTLEAPMFMNKFDGDTLQDGTPTPDTPVEIQSVEGIQTITIGDGTDSDNYTIDLGNIKIYNGDYITGTPDNWSIYRENAEVILNETSTNISDYVNSNLTNVYGFSANITDMNNITSTGSGLCNILSEIKWNYNYDAESYYLASNTFVFKINKTIIDNQTGNTTKDKLKSYLATNNLHLVGKLATPTTTSITDTYLISQLNALYNAKSKNGQTNISVSGNLPMILEVSALKDEI